MSRGWPKRSLGFFCKVVQKTQMNILANSIADSGMLTAATGETLDRQPEELTEGDLAT